MNAKNVSVFHKTHSLPVSESKYIYLLSKKPLLRRKYITYWNSVESNIKIELMCSVF